MSVHEHGYMHTIAEQSVLSESVDDSQKNNIHFLGVNSLRTFYHPERNCV